MKTIKYINLVLLFFTVSVYAQQNSPQIEFENTTIDYGTIENGSDGERIFSFKNTGTADLVITNVKSSCGCTIPKKPDGPIAPGDTNEIVVRYDTKRVGPFRKTITVSTNQENNPIIALKLKGTVLPIQ
ncbi:DUF1573 domain-containing protein [Flavobacteriaceae bacterium]|nr:DUF1573 domain-containing protein [Flavobacteriaceae bacterium]MDA9571970.1 DUF1573 domain-containing protein [Flavobacteriaceae bacterium]MDC3354445.1 DUF1573 domain-containing protein [Flavobacteriaceae bacterium]